MNTLTAPLLTTKDVYITISSLNPTYKNITAMPLSARAEDMLESLKIKKCFTTKEKLLKYFYNLAITEGVKEYLADEEEYRNFNAVRVLGCIINEELINLLTQQYQICHTSQ